MRPNETIGFAIKNRTIDFVERLRAGGDLDPSFLRVPLI